MLKHLQLLVVCYANDTVFNQYNSTLAQLYGSLLSVIVCLSCVQLTAS